MRSKTLLIVLMLSAAVLLSGCQTTILVHDTTTAKVIPVFKDFAGSRGYNFTYRNETTGTYGLDLGSVYQPFTSSTTRTSSYVNVHGEEGQPSSGYEDTNWNTVAYSGRYVQALANVRIAQSGPDVMIFIDTNDAGGTELNDFIIYLRQYGFNAENK